MAESLASSFWRLLVDEGIEVTNYQAVEELPLWIRIGGTAMFNPGAYENSGPDGIGVLEIGNGAESPEGQPRQFVPLKRTELRGEVTGPLALLRLTQVYGYSREQCDRVLEAIYR